MRVYGGSLKFVLSFALARFAREIWCIISVVLVPRSPCSVCVGVAYEYRKLDSSREGIQRLGRRQRRVLGALPVCAWSFLAEHHEEALPVAPSVASVAVKGPVAFSCSR